jgi:hypothetical protein
MFVDLGPGGTPRALGIALTEAALTGLAPRMNTTSRCFDKDKDGEVAHGECLGDYQSTLVQPGGAADLGLPVRWATVNWNPEGHMPRAVSMECGAFRLPFLVKAGTHPRHPARSLRGIHPL